MKEFLLIWWCRLHRWLAHELARPRGQRLVRPLLGLALVLALLIGGLCAFSPAPRKEPVPVRRTVCLPVIVQPPPTTAGPNQATCP